MDRPVKTAFVQYTLPAAYPPVMNAATILAEKNVRVELWGIGGFGDSDQLHIELKPGMTQHLMKYSAPGWRQKFHYFWFVIQCFLRTLISRPKFLYVSEYLSYPVGWLVSYIPGVSVIAHEHDTPPEDGGTATRFFLWIRRKLFRRARITVIPQIQRAQLVAKAGRPKRIEVVWNCPRLGEIVPHVPRENSQERILWYHGSIVPGQFPESAVLAIALLPRHIKLKFAGYATIGQKDYPTELLKLASSLGVEDRVEYIGTKPTRKVLFQAASECDIGLALFARNFREAMVGASNKPFDYLACGLALLTNDTDEWQDFFKDCKCAKACNPESPQAIAAAVMEFLADPVLFQQNRAAGQKMIRETWNYEFQFAPVLREILGEQSIG